MALLTAKEKLIAVYNYDLTANGRPTVNPAEFEMSAPAAYSGPRSPQNTVIYLSPLPTSPNIGLSTIYYNRLNLSVVTTLRVTKGSATNLATILPLLNIELGIVFATTDFQDVALPAVGSSFTLTATPSNILLLGSCSVMLD